MRWVLLLAVARAVCAGLACEQGAESDSERVGLVARLVGAVCGAPWRVARVGTQLLRPLTLPKKAKP